jgi:hypothetical protein
LLRAERARRDAFIKGASGSAAHDPPAMAARTLDTMAERLQGTPPRRLATISANGCATTGLMFDPRAE